MPRTGCRFEETGEKRCALPPVRLREAGLRAGVWAQPGRADPVSTGELELR